jgi:hypothetical protein|eukprot:COSAG02_NODE_3711_length_6341_cov_4.360622_5_plen_92_part_00
MRVPWAIVCFLGDRELTTAPKAATRCIDAINTGKWDDNLCSFDTDGTQLSEVVAQAVADGAAFDMGVPQDVSKCMIMGLCICVLGTVKLSL